MPIEKVKILHKFGIISQNHKRLLQERLLTTKAEEYLNESSRTSGLICLQITEDFVKKYNESDKEQKLKLDLECSKILEKIKKRLFFADQIDNLTIQLCWAELSQLIQCSSSIQDECIDALLWSLEYTTLSELQIPTLFFLAEAIIYWIRTETINNVILRSYEINLLKIGHLIMKRLLCHLIDNKLDNEEELKNHLAIYLNGFEELDSAYSSYPDALLYMNYIIEVGRIICPGKKLDEKAEFGKLETIMSADTNKQKINADFYIYDGKRAKKPLTRLSDTFACAISIFTALRKKTAGDEAFDYHLTSLLKSSMHINEQNWVDVGLVLNVLGECAKINLKAMETFLTISENYSTVKIESNGMQMWCWELACVYVEVLANICMFSQLAVVRKLALLGFHSNISNLHNTKEFFAKKAYGYGLVDTAFFNPTNNEDGKSWKIRYSSVKCIEFIREKYSNSMNEEVSKICWVIKLILSDTERHPSVLEALKFTRVATDKAGKKDSMTKSEFNKKLYSSKMESIYSQIATDLEQSLMSSQSISDLSSEAVQAVHNENKTTKIKEEKSRNFYDKSVDLPKPKEISVKRLTIGESLAYGSNGLTLGSVPGNQRKNLDLMRIMDDQLRKDEKAGFLKYE